MGDVIQPMALEHLLASVAPNVCFWYAHPWDEDLVKGNRIGEFFGTDTPRLIHLTHDDIWQVQEAVNASYAAPAQPNHRSTGTLS